MKDNRIAHLDKYEILKEEEIIEIDSTGYLLRHRKSGAHITLLLNEDNNKVFNIAFRTPAPDDTGVPHILEHSVLNGSKNFPLKDPFVELVKGSLNTFLNAMTYPDKTMYPVASCNSKDFQNLVNVYMDAVFFPNIYDKEEIFRQEGWSYKLESPEDELTINGVVYNEMKGAFSSAEEVLSREIFGTLFPDNNYANESGGEPKTIPDLNYSQFLDFHSKYYHPSNSYIYIYGDVDMVEKLTWLDKEYLSKYDVFGIESEIEQQEPFAEVKELTIDYPIAANEPTEHNTFLSYNKVVGDYSNTELNVAFQVLEYAMLSMPGAKIKEALQDAGIGKEIKGMYDSGIMQPYFSIVAKGANQCDKDKFISIIEEQLKDIVEKGFDKKTLLAGLNSIEFRTREADFGSFPKGLLYGISMFSSWLYDKMNPFAYLKTDEIFKALKEKINTRYFEELVSKYFLNNQHGAIITAIPKQGLNNLQELELAQKLKEYKESLSKEEINLIVEKTRKLKEYQELEESEEALKSIPVLELEDISKGTLKFDLDEKSVDGVKVLHHNFFTNKIAYITMAFKTDGLPKEYVPYVSLFKTIFGMMDTENYTYQELCNEVNIHTGGINIGTGIYNDYKDVGKYNFLTEVRLKSTYDEVDFAFKIISEILFNTKLDNKKRLKEIVSEIKSRQQSQLSNSGNSTAALRATSYYSEVSYINDVIRGVSFYEFIADLEKHFDDKYDEIIQSLKTVIKYIFRQENLIISYTGNDDGFTCFKDAASCFVKSLSNDEITPVQNVYNLTNKNEGFKTASQVQYVAQAGNFIRAGYEYTGALHVLRIIMSYEYLWTNIRVKGGAYGCSNYSLRNGDMVFSSYRDPNLESTLNVYKNIAEYVRKFDISDRDMLKYIIGTVSELDTPLTYSSRGTRSYSAYMCNITSEMVTKERMQVLNATQESIRALADMIDAVIKQNYICVVGNEDKIQSSVDIFDEVKQVF